MLRAIANVLWLVLSGFWLFLGYAVAGLIMFVLIITIPFGIASWRIGAYALWPFGRVVVPQADAGAPSCLGNGLWFMLAGWWLALAHVVSGVVLCITIIGIPFGVANFKLAGVAINPLGKEIMGEDEAAARYGAARSYGVPTI